MEIEMMDFSDYESDLDNSLNSSGSDFCDVDSEDSFYGDQLLCSLKQMNRKFRLACKQVVLLNNEIEYQQNRYDRAVDSGSRSFRYFLRLKIATLEGIRNVFYEYASQHADKLDALHVKMLREGVIEEELDLEALDGEGEDS